MTPDQWIGSAGVAILLLAFALNVRGTLRSDSASYAAMNAAGAGLACLASWMIAYYPFVVLEGFWALVSLHALIASLRADS